jgi:nucleoid-associated protein YgaU
MRVLWLAVVVAGLWWWSDSWGGGVGDVGAAPRVPASTDGAALDRVLTAPPAAGQAAPSSADTATDAAAATAAVDDLLPGLGQRQPTAIAAGWALLTRLGGIERQRLLAAMAPAGDDIAAKLAALGADNSFLHSAEGRARAAEAAAAIGACADPEAVPAGSRLLALMTKGRIRQEDQAQRAFVGDIYAQHRVRVDRWLCDPGNVAGARSYTVQRGDSLARIAARFRKEKLLVEDGTLAILNRIHNPNTIREGQKIKVPVATITTVVEKRSFSMTVWLGDDLLRLYWVGHGEHDRTPVAEFTVGVKQPKPDWTAPDGRVYAYGHPENILGEYFVKFLNDTYVGFGAHGTPRPETIGTMSSMGCIRMYAPDIAEVFRLVPMGTKVIVRATESLR